MSHMRKFKCWGYFGLVPQRNFLSETAKAEKGEFQRLKKSISKNEEKGLEICVPKVSLGYPFFLECLSESKNKHPK